MYDALNYTIKFKFYYFFLIIILESDGPEFYLFNLRFEFKNIDFEMHQLIYLIIKLYNSFYNKY